MATLYIVSVEGGTGKTAVALGIALGAQERGLRVGYMKPVSARLSLDGGRLFDPDVTLAKRVLALSAPEEKLCPVQLTDAVRRKVLAGESVDATPAVKDAFAELSRDVDLMIVEGPTSLHVGSVVGLDAARVAELTDAKAIVVLRGDFQDAAEPALVARNALGERAIGAVVNSVPLGSIGDVTGLFGPFLHRHGMQLFGVVPVNRLPGAFTVSELVSLLDGQIIAGTGSAEAVVESFIVGAMRADAALRYFMRHLDKAVITTGDRSDIILAALDTPTRCIILCGNLTPDQAAITRAAQRQVPLLLVPLDIMETVRRIEEARAPVRFSSSHGVERLRGLIDRELYVGAMLREVGL